MAYTVQFLLILVATVAMATVGLVSNHGTELAGERLLGALVLVGLPLVLGSWFRRLRREDPPIWWELRQRLPGATGERLPVLEPATENPFFPLPWFLLPLIPIAVSLGVVTGQTVLFLAPVAATVGWVGLVGLVVLSWVVGHRAETSGGLQRMLADFRQGPSAGGAYDPEWWAGIVFDRHRPRMDYATLETLFRTGLKDAYGDSHRWSGQDVTRLPALFAKDGWRCVLEAEGSIPRDASRHHIRTDLPEAMEGWQCPRCHTVNEPAARRCRLSVWRVRKSTMSEVLVCRERRPGLSRLAELGHTTLESVALVVYMVLYFGPLVLVILAIYGALALHGSGDPTVLVAAAILTVAWRVSIRLPVGIAREARESLEMFVAVFGGVVVEPAVAIAETLRRLLSSGRYVKVFAGNSHLSVQPSTVEAGTVTFELFDQDGSTPLCVENGILVWILRTDLPARFLPVDPRRLAGRVGEATPIWDAGIEYGKTRRFSLDLTPGRYVIGCRGASAMEEGEPDHHVRVRSTLRVKPAASAGRPDRGM